jgi:hypothetical protein
LAGADCLGGRYVCTKCIFFIKTQFVRIWYNCPNNDVCEML